MNQVSTGLAFSAGLLSFLSPCVLPLIPAYISYMTASISEKNRNTNAKRLLMIKALGFVLGFSIVFILLGASVTTIGKLFIKNQAFIRKAGGILIIIFGLHTLGVLKIKFLYYEKKFTPVIKITGSFGSILLGMAFAAGWTPCVGPILASILIYAGASNTIASGIFLLIAYSLGMAVPFLLTALFLEAIAKYLNKLTRFMPVITAISGIVLIALGFLIFFNKASLLNSYISF